MIIVFRTAGILLAFFCKLNACATYCKNCGLEVPVTLFLFALAFDYAFYLHLQAKQLYKACRVG